jgi:hypothetical protein
MTWDGVEFIVRFTRVREELKPVEIYPADTLEPIRPDWIAITHGLIWSKRRPDGIDGYNLYFLMDDGRCLAMECFETLEITLDQAKAIAGVRKDEWQECRVEVTSEDGSFRWSDVSGSAQASV